MVKAIDKKLFGNIYYGKRVFITGHTGFKGSWLAFWLQKMGAIVKGYSLAPQTDPNHWQLLKLDLESVYADIRDRERLEREIMLFKPDIVFHLAAQPIVRYSYENPIETYETNVIGTLKLFEACRKTESIRAIINVTSDKCYENKEWVFGYRENDALGGYDPYSSSKGCSEILTSSYRNSYWNLSKYEIDHQVLLASCRAGNVIGGGDWAQDRLIPDIIKSIISKKEVIIRNPNSTRPWQHVLDPLSGYLIIGEKLLNKNIIYAKAWNFGPSDEESLSVKNVLDRMKEYIPQIKISFENSANLHEAKLLKLDCSQAYSEVGWKSVWKSNMVFDFTADWYKTFISSKEILTSNHIDQYVQDAKNKNIVWSI